MPFFNDRHSQRKLYFLHFMLSSLVHLAIGFASFYFTPYGYQSILLTGISPKALTFLVYLFLIRVILMEHITSIINTFIWMTLPFCQDSLYLWEVSPIIYGILYSGYFLSISCWPGKVWNTLSKYVLICEWKIIQQSFAFYCSYMPLRVYFSIQCIQSLCTAFWLSSS